MIKKMLLKDLVNYLPALIVPSFVQLISIPIITSMFSPDHYGSYTLVVSSASIMAILTTNSFSASLIRFFPLYQAEKRIDIFNGMTIILTAISTGSVFLLGALAIFFIPQPYYLFWVAGLGLFLVNSLIDVFTKIIRAQRYALGFTLFNVWNSIMGFSIGFILVKFYGFGILGFIWGTVISFLIAAPFLWKTAFGGNFVLKKVKIFSHETKELFKYGIPALSICILSWVLNLSDRYIIGLLCGSFDLGIYSANYAIPSRGMFLVVTLFLLAGNPIVFNCFEKKGLEETKKVMTSLARGYLLFSIPAVFVFALMAKPFSAVLIAPEYNSGHHVFCWVAAGTFFLGLTNIFSLGLGIYKKMNYLMICYSAGGVLNIILNFIFVRYLGYMGAAVNTFVSYFIVAFLTYIISSRFFTWSFPFISLFKILGSCLIMGIILYSFSNKTSLPYLILALCVGALTYFSSLFILKELTKDEIKAVLSIFKN